MTAPAPAQDSALLDLIRTTIRTQGPISVADYMALALGHPEYGYYRTRDPLGTHGDFTTAPEISQMFGELIGLWAGQAWLDRGAPTPVSVIELGPGRGTLMSDALRALKIVPGFLDSVRVHLVETSPTLRDRQRMALKDYVVQWHDDVTSALDASEGALIVLANEFFDALPIRQFVKTPKGWHERMIGLDETSVLCFGLSADPVPIVFEGPDGAIQETSPMSTAIMGEIARAIAARSGLGLIIDYGHGRTTPGDTLQAVRNHQFHDVLADPGMADLTAHVDFGALARAARENGAQSWNLLTQGDFLTRLGIQARAERLTAKAAPAQRDAIAAACERLIALDQMGTLFKVLALTDTDRPPPAFDTLPTAMTPQTSSPQ